MCCNDRNTDKSNAVTASAETILTRSLKIVNNNQNVNSCKYLRFQKISLVAWKRSQLRPDAVIEVQFAALLAAGDEAASAQAIPNLLIAR